jgi:hypothetical protein
MPQDANFGRILDEKLEREGLRYGAVGSHQCEADDRGTWQPPQRPVFLFGNLPPGVSAGGAAWTSAYPRPAAPQPARKPARRLTVAQQRALDALRAAGAIELTADFSEAELKSAYRTLARRFHPDRHPSADAVERARLAQIFGRVSEAYRELAKLFMH